MPIVHPTSLDDDRLAPFRNVGDAELRREAGLFLAEGRLVVRRLLAEGRYRVRAVLVTESAREALADVLPAADVDVFIVPAAWMQAVTGFNLHRGCLAVGERQAAADWRSLAGSARRLLVLEGVGNPDNVGGLFRSARAFGVDAVLLGPGCGDPLYRKAIRVSCGAALSVPFASALPWPEVLVALKAAGVDVWALTTSKRATALQAAILPHVPPRLALLVGAEGPGLTDASLDAASQHVRIPIDAAADSLNVNVAAGIALAATALLPLTP